MAADTRASTRRGRGVVLGATVSVAVIAGCADDGRRLRPPSAPLPATTTVVTSTPALPTADIIAAEQALGADSIAAAGPSPGPASVSSPTAAPPSITIDRLFSPANATAEMHGSGLGPATAEVSVDGMPADLISLDRSADGSFVARVWIEAEGAHTVCVAGACGRVFTLAPDAETRQQVEAKINEALALAAAEFDYASEFPGWSVRIAGPASGTGGSVDAAARAVVIYANRGRSVDDFVRTVLHEFGHVADTERLDDAERARYLELRGIDPSTGWRSADAHLIEDWAMQPSEDFAEVMVMLWTDGRWLPRTGSLAPAPGAEQLELVAALVGQP